MFKVFSLFAFALVACVVVLAIVTPSLGQVYYASYPYAYTYGYPYAAYGAYAYAPYGAYGYYAGYPYLLKK